MKKYLALAAGLFCLGQSAQRASAIIIIRDYSGMMNNPCPTNYTGTGEPIEIIDYEMDLLETQYPGTNHVLTLHFTWGSEGGYHVLNQQTNGLEVEGTIVINNDNNANHFSHFFTSDPRRHPEYTNYSEVSVMMNGIGPINAQRMYTANMPGPQADFQSEIGHEKRHALGMSIANTAFQAEAVDMDVDITSPRWFPSLSIPLQTNFYGVVAHFTYYPGGQTAITRMSGGNGPGWFVMDSDLDIIGNQQMCGYTNVCTNYVVLPTVAMSGWTSNSYTTNGSGPHKVITLTSSTPMISLSWTNPVGKYVLESCNTVKGGVWTTVTNVPTYSNYIYKVSLPITAGNKIFRLALRKNLPKVNMSHEPSLMMLAPAKDISKDIPYYRRDY